jgi:hypothetical protein
MTSGCQLPGLRSLDYVLMFIPVEPAFLLAIDRQPELISDFAGVVVLGVEITLIGDKGHFGVDNHVFTLRQAARIISNCQACAPSTMC